MEFLIPEGISKMVPVKSNIFKDSCVLFTSDETNKSCLSQTASKLLLNAANNAAVEDSNVIFFRPSEFVFINELHIHGTPPITFGSWDRIKFIYPTQDSLIRYLCNFHIGKQSPDLIIVEDLEKFIGDDLEQKAGNFIALTCLLRDTLLFVRSSSGYGDHGSNCKLLASCNLSPTSHGLDQAYILESTNDAHFRLAESRKFFQFELILNKGEIFFSDFSYNPSILKFEI